MKGGTLDVRFQFAHEPTVAADSATGGVRRPTLNKVGVAPFLAANLRRPGAPPDSLLRAKAEPSNLP